MQGRRITERTRPRARRATAGFDVDLHVRVDDSLAEGVVHTADSEHATLLVIPASAGAASTGVPAVVVGRTGADGIETIGVPDVVVSRLTALGLAANPAT